MGDVTYTRFVVDEDKQNLSSREQRAVDPGRVLALTDGVFAIIITILVLELKVPDLSSGQSLYDSLVEIQPTFSAFVISFLIVGMYWVWHRSTFANVRYVDTQVVWLNILFLLPASMIPFAASVLGEFQGEATSLHLYGAVLIAVTLIRIALFWYVGRHRWLLWDDISEKSRRLGIFMSAAPLVVYAVAMVLADSLPTLSLVLYFAVPLAYFALVAFLRVDPRTKAAAQDLS